jgi:malate synthase
MSRSSVFIVLTLIVIDLRVEDLSNKSSSFVYYLPKFLSTFLKAPSFSDVTGFVSVLWTILSNTMKIITMIEVTAASVENS